MVESEQRLKNKKSDIIENKKNKKNIENVS